MVNAQSNLRHDNNFTHKQHGKHNMCFLTVVYWAEGMLLELQVTTCGDGKRGHMLFVIHQVFPRTRTTARLGSCTHLNVSLWAYKGQNMISRTTLCRRTNKG